MTNFNGVANCIDLLQVRDIYLHADPFTPENNLTTPTFKNKRPQLRRKFAEQITVMYNNNKQQQQQQATTPGAASGAESAAASAETNGQKQ